MKIILFLLLLTSCMARANELDSNAIISKKEIFLRCKKDTGCEFIGSSSTGTASRIFWNNKYYWLTAAHVCSSAPDNSLILNSDIIAIVAGSDKTEETTIVKIDHEKDLCILEAEPGAIKRIAKKEPKPGDEVKAIAYPGGIFDPSILPIYDGRWSGMISDYDKCLITIPVSGGSSGSAVLNKNDKIVGVISSVYVDFNHLTIATCYYDIISFLTN